MVQHFVLNHSCFFFVFFCCVLWVLLEDRTTGKLFLPLSRTPWDCTVAWTRHPVPDAAKQPQNRTEPPPCFFVDTTGPSFGSVNIELMLPTSPSCPQEFLLESLWLVVNMQFDKLQPRCFMSCFPQRSPPHLSIIKSTLTQIGRWCHLTWMHLRLYNHFERCAEIFSYHSYYPSVQFVIILPLEITDHIQGMARGA